MPAPWAAPSAALSDDGNLDASGFRFAEEVTAGGGASGLVGDGRFQSIPTDLRGTVLAEANLTPRIASPFGQRDVHPAVSAAIDYVQKGYDAHLGLVRMGVRDYDPEINRFATPDPLFLESPEKCIGAPIDCNLYSYARNTPLAPCASNEEWNVHAWRGRVHRELSRAPPESSQNRETMSPVIRSVHIHDLFVIADEPQRRRLIARVESFDWPSAIGLEVIIVGGGERFSACQIGFGNVEGFAIVELALTKAIDESEARLRVLLERKSPMELRLA